MVYRIRYSDGGPRCEGEAIVEAASPTEAMVKFCHTSEADPDPGALRQRITSVVVDGDPGQF